MTVKPSEVSKKGRRYVGADGEIIRNEGELDLRLAIPTDSKKPISSRNTFQAARFRKPLLAVSTVTEKGNAVWFDEGGSYILSGSSQEMRATRAAIELAKRKVSLTERNGVYNLRAQWMDQPGAEQQQQQQRTPTTQPDVDMSGFHATGRPMITHHSDHDTEAIRPNPQTN